MRTPKNSLTILVVVTFCLTASLQAQTPPAPGDSPSAKPADSPPAKPAERVPEGPPQAAQYWLGLWCGPIPPQLRAQIELPEKQGVLVQSVAPDSPAAKAGILAGDVLVRVGDKPLVEPRELLQAVEAAQGKPLKIELLRAGKPLSVEATPARRPPQFRPPSGVDPQSSAMRRWLDEMWSAGQPGGDVERPPLRFRFMHPGAIVPGNVLVPAPLPSNVTVVITKQGAQPARVVVTRGDEKWECTEKELDKLPADLRPHVERLLGHNPLGLVGDLRTFDFVPKMSREDGSWDPSDAEPGPDTPDLGASDAAPRFESLEKRLDELNRRMDALLKAVEELRVRPEPPKSSAP